MISISIFAKSFSLSALIIMLNKSLFVSLRFSTSLAAISLILFLASINLFLYEVNLVLIALMLFTVNSVLEKILLIVFLIISFSTCVEAKFVIK
ncbi:Uncharacterised protein [Mycoplasmopsis edwardii]|uniref:Uncharacterized protein n=1 Tax=Mycoplasmopsis edwardii TaxID=53558 RepID=A0A3B0PXR9_9BACT|nr:Uncharacterised protein [Mycoplasmopsis edwardii]